MLMPIHQCMPMLSSLHFLWAIQHVYLLLWSTRTSAIAISRSLPSHWVTQLSLNNTWIAVKTELHNLRMPLCYLVSRLSNTSATIAMHQIKLISILEDRINRTILNPDTDHIDTANQYSFQDVYRPTYNIVSSDWYICMRLTLHSLPDKRWW